MEKTKRILVVGDNQVGKTQLLKNLFGSLKKSENADGQVPGAEPLSLQDQLSCLLPSQSADGEAEKFLTKFLGGSCEQDSFLNSMQKPTIGCQVHTYLLNDYYSNIGNPNGSQSSSSGAQTYHFLEFYELGGHISIEENLHRAFV